MSSYDQSLLGEAPRATRAQLQEGYNVDLLEQPVRRTPSVRHPPPQTPQPAPVFAENDAGDKYSSPSTRTSFWRSRNGIITLTVVAVVVIGAVVGGAVGGTVTKSSNNNVGAISRSATSQTSPASSLTTASQDIASGGTRPAGSSTSTPATSTAGQNNIG